MNIKTILTIAAVLVVLGAGIAVARPAANDGGFWNGMMGQGNGYGGMMGQGTGNGTTGVCGLSGTAGISNDAAPITIEQAKDSVEKYLATTGNTDIVLTEVLEFDNNFYAGVKEKSTGTHAFELLVNKYTGAVVPEMGPNMMWNTKYGHMALNTQESSTGAVWYHNWHGTFVKILEVK